MHTDCNRFIKVSSHNMASILGDEESSLRRVNDENLRNSVRKRMVQREELPVATSGSYKTRRSEDFKKKKKN